MFGDMVVKESVWKICWMYNDIILVGFVGFVVDLFVFFFCFEVKLE